MMVIVGVKTWDTWSSRACKGIVNWAWLLAVWIAMDWAFDIGPELFHPVQV
jgi:hypothetical protein